jgi:hypothetical protein
MQLLYAFDTRLGPFYIGEKSGRFWIVHNDIELDSFATAWQAAEDLAGGYSVDVDGVDTATLGIPADLSEWTRLLIIPS